MRYACTIVVLFVSALLASAQGFECKSPIEYDNRNQADPKPSTVTRISGRAISEVGHPAREIGPVSVCLGLFTEEDHSLVASAVADDEGRFKFDKLPTGRFRLVVRDPLNVYCPANIPLEVVKKGRGKERQLVIHMRPARIDECSYGDFK